MSSVSWVTILLFSLDWIVRLGLAARVILGRSSVPVTLAWLLILLFFPFGGIALYLLIGENRLGQWRVARYNRLSSEIDAETVSIWRHHHLDWNQEQDAYRQAARMGTAVSGFPPVGGNALELISECDKMVDRLIGDIDSAQHHCHLLYYIWMESGCGVRVVSAMVRAAQRGVQCRVIVDSVGSRPFLRSPLAAQLRDAGVQVIEALPVNPIRMLFARIDLRNHRKIAVIDGRIGYAGSQNITDDTFKFNPHYGIGPWVDATLRLEGPAVHALQTIFLRDWILDSYDEFASFEDFFPEFPPTEGGSIVHVIPSGPGTQIDAVHQSFLSTIYAAREELVITTPYFVPDEATKAAICMAALRGVEVTLVVPKEPDAPLVAAAARSHYLDLLEAGVNLYEFHAGLLHSKTMTTDRKLAIMSSANVDMRSFWLNFEVTLFIYDDDFSSLVRFMQKDYLNQARKVKREDWNNRNIFQRFGDNCAQLVGPLL